MKSRISVPLWLLIALVAISPGCAAIGGIFKAGVWAGLVIAVIVVGVILLVARGLRG